MSDPDLNFQHPALPRKQGDIDWDRVAERYLEQVLSPWHPLMLEGDPCRNRVAQFFRDNPPSDPMRVADFGCGNGYLLSFVQSCGEYVAVDRSRAFLKRAAAFAAEMGICFMPIRADFRKFAVAEGHRFDFVVSVNSILPQTRREVLDSFQSVARHLKPAGQFVAILPAYDATIALREAWQKHHAQHHGHEQAEHYRRHFDSTKLANDDECSYADDGVHVQCYHTERTIQRELTACGLKIARLEKVFYPHELAKKFDYAFPDATQEIWDWFVLAQHGESFV